MSSLTGVVGLLSGKPRNPISPDGRMALADHLRELRARLIRSALLLVVAFCVALVFYHQVFEVLQHPYNKAITELSPKDRKKVLGTLDGPAAGLLLQFKLCGVAAIIASSPYWIYQLWAFVVPGLHAKEKRYSRIFAAGGRGRCSWPGWRSAT